MGHQIFVIRFCNTVCFLQKVEPILTLITFFQGNLQFGYEIPSSMGKLGFMYIGAD